MQLAKAIAQDPLTVHTNLTNALMQQGLIRAEAEQAAKEIMDDATDGEPYEDAELSPAMRKELERRDAELEAIKEQLSAQDFEKATEMELQKLNKEFTDLKGTYEINDKQEQAILELLDAAVARGEDITVFQAAKKLVDITGVGFKKKGASTPAAPAPTVLGGSGGNGVPFEGVEIPKDDKAKREMLAQLFKNNLARN
jgi:predicted nuclease with TOPRIM domain